MSPSNACDTFFILHEVGSCKRALDIFTTSYFFPVSKSISKLGNMIFNAFVPGQALLIDQALDS